MSTVSINNNLLANNVANTLTQHYGRLSTSTQRLSSGLRINSAADDAAGLAIRELMRADIAALEQGARNANDAISMIQTFDGALSVIDEKLIRMKELAEQAATGTYDSTQRLMIDSEYQAMAAEIDRIARATDFNGIKLLDGDFEVPGIEIVGPDGKTYEVKTSGSFTKANVAVIPNTAKADKDWASLANDITDPAGILGNSTISIVNNNIGTIGSNYLAVSIGYSSLIDGTTLNIIYDPNIYTTMGWAIDTGYGYIEATLGTANTFLWMDTAPGSPNYGNQISATIVDANGNPASASAGDVGTWTVRRQPSFTITGKYVDAANTTCDDSDIANGNLTFNIALTNGDVLVQTFSGITNGANSTLAGFIDAKINLSVKDTTASPGGGDDDDADKIPDNVVKIHFGSMNDSAEDYYYIEKRDATVKGLGLEGVDIKTQDNAQEALVKINDAIVEKDKIRSYYGAMQNRLENTITNIKTQAENLCTAESRISDTDVAQEMTSFVRSQVLTQSSVAMLAQANMMPQIVMRLING